MIPGQSPLVLNKSEGVAISLSKQTPDKLTGLAVHVGGKEKFLLPHDGSLFNGIKDNSYVATTVSSLTAWAHNRKLPFGFLLGAKGLC